MLHACFQLLVDFLEEDQETGHLTDWDFDEKHRNALAEMLVLRDWWELRFRMSEESVSAENHYAKDNEMLSRLIAVRWAMWV